MQYSVLSTKKTLRRNNDCLYWSFLIPLSLITNLWSHICILLIIFTCIHAFTVSISVHAFIISSSCIRSERFMSKVKSALDKYWERRNSSFSEADLPWRKHGCGVPHIRILYMPLEKIHFYNIPGLTAFSVIEQHSGLDNLLCNRTTFWTWQPL